MALYPGVTRIFRGDQWQRRGRQPVLGGQVEPTTVNAVGPVAPQTTLQRWLAPVSNGAYWGFYPSGGSTAVFDAMETAGSRKFAISKQYYNFSSPIPTPAHLLHAQGGRTIHIAMAFRATGSYSSLLPAPGVPTLNVWTYNQTINGSMDAYWRDFAQKCKAIPNPFLVDFNHEPENQANGNGRPETFSDPTWYSGRANTTMAYRQSILKEFADANRRIIGIFHSEGVANAIFVCSYASVGSNGAAYAPHYAGLWPGDDVIDIVAWDPYNALSSTANWNPPVGSWAAGYNAISGGLLDTAPFYTGTGAKTKPYMLSEYGCGPDPLDPNRRPTWLGQISDAIDAYPNIKGIQYFSSLGSSSNGGTNIHDYPAEKNAFSAEGLSPQFTPMPPTS